MELLYIWINQSENNVFENQGINLSPEFNFVVDVTETGVYFNLNYSRHCLIIASTTENH